MTTVRPSPAFDIIVEFTSHLVKSIKDNVDTIATDLHSSNLLSESEYNHIVKLSSSDESFIRAVRTITAVRNKIERNPLLLDVFLDVLTKHGESVNKCVEKISQSCQQKVNGSITQVSGLHEPRFLCPFCQKCSVKKFLVSGCSSPYEEIDNLRFPFLNTTTLSRIERRSLEDNLITEFKEIKQSFQQLRHLLTGQNYRFREIKSLLLEYSCIADDPELLCANSIDDILDVVFEHASFFNYEFLEIIIAQFGSSSDNKHLQKFLSNLKTYCSRNSVEGPLCLSSTRYSNILFVALQLQNDKDLNLWQAKLLSHQLAKVVLKISRCEIQLVSVQDSGALIFSLAKNVFEKNFPVSIKKLESVGLSIVYSEVQSGLITVNGQCEKQSSLNQNIPMHQVGVHTHTNTLDTYIMHIMLYIRTVQVCMYI